MIDEVIEMMKKSGALWKEAIDTLALLKAAKAEPPAAVESGEFTKGFQHLCCEPNCGALACEWCGACRTEHSEDPVKDCPQSQGRKPVHRTTALCNHVKAQQEQIAKLNQDIGHLHGQGLMQAERIEKLCVENGILWEKNKTQADELDRLTAENKAKDERIAELGEDNKKLMDRLCGLHEGIEQALKGEKI